MQCLLCGCDAIACLGIALGLGEGADCIVLVQLIHLPLTYMELIADTFTMVPIATTLDTCMAGEVSIALVVCGCDVMI